MKGKKFACLCLLLCLLLSKTGIIFCRAEAYLCSGEVYYNNRNEEMKIALTFDDGPHPRLTPKILDILDKYGIKATFFVIGENAKYYPDALMQISERGHEIANHTYSHITFSRSNLSKLKGEIEMCEKEIFNRTECKTKLFRPPEGMMSQELQGIIKGMDYTVILWDLDTRDWNHTPPQKISNNVTKNIRSGDVILMHDFIGYNSPTPEALELFIPILLDRGYKFVTVSELIGIK